MFRFQGRVIARGVFYHVNGGYVQAQAKVSGYFPVPIVQDYFHRNIPLRAGFVQVLLRVVRPFLRVHEYLTFSVHRRFYVVKVRLYGGNVQGGGGVVPSIITILQGSLHIVTHGEWYPVYSLGFSPAKGVPNLVRRTIFSVSNVLVFFWLRFQGSSRNARPIMVQRSRVNVMVTVYRFFVFASLFPIQYTVYIPVL